MAPDLQSLLVWPLFVGGGVLAVAWTAWEMLTGKKDIGGGVSLAASGLATFAVGVFAVTVLLNIWASVFRRFGAKYPRFLTLDWMVPIGVVFGFVLGLAIWR